MDIKLGTRFRTTKGSNWTSKDGTKGVERITVIARVTEVFPTRFDYVVETVESVTNPLPGTEGRGWTGGGMAFFAIEKGVMPFEGIK